MGLSPIRRHLGSLPRVLCIWVLGAGTGACGEDAKSVTCGPGTRLSGDQCIVGSDGEGGEPGDGGGAPGEGGASSDAGGSANAGGSAGSG